ncbi:MAG TPA: DUF3368 domain-containing protein [Anaerolineales bacterium]|nr:DUF3368 domain-containing protein [Anaerolineales bacterium]
MKVVSNASPLVSLSRIGKLELLHKLYSEIYIPDAVWQEVVLDGAGQPGAGEVGTVQWIKKQAVQNVQLVQALRQNLDAGEAEAIVLALEVKADLLVMDERLGRETARHLGVRFTGVVGALVEARQKEYIQAIAPLLDALRYSASFRISDQLYNHVLKNQGEI